MNLESLLNPAFAAIRLTQRLKPAAGEGAKVFPPTFEGGAYCFEQRRIGGQSVPCVLLDGVASAANRQEEALADLVARGIIELPHFVVDFSAFPEVGEVTTLTAPHRVFDAIFRDSELDGKPFPKHALATELSKANAKNATSLFAHAPTALLFGAWDSTGAAGGLGNKFARSVVTELIGVNVDRGESRGGVRQDPLAISRYVEIEVDKSKDWKPKGIVDKTAKGDRIKGTRPSEVNHGNILVSAVTDPNDRTHTLKGGVTCDYALQQSVISMIGLRRLRFPIDGRGRDSKVDDAARAVLVSLGLVALAASRERGYALRSRCDLVAEGLAPFELIEQDGSAKEASVDVKATVALYKAAIGHARELGLPWEPVPKKMKPQAKLSKLVALSREAGAE